MKINLVTVGKIKEGYLSAAIEEYAKRLSRFCKLNIIEVAEGRNKAEEGIAVSKKLKGKVIVFDIGGELVSSQEFATLFAEAMVNGDSEFSLVIGGSEGLDAAVIGKADRKISFGRVTYPHQLMRVIVMEQLYRAVTINNNITYHK
ncbi:MAG: 23S rRNA (pseudouridine(1915)-N(3))-methyltransferase RlmH [Clostridia bacterium]|nr:23S rRNA (pseudouridine(1915)-N(3))-methyltransferase RlmH [Clostridia bacterium]